MFGFGKKEKEIQLYNPYAECQEVKIGKFHLLQKVTYIKYNNKEKGYIFEFDKGENKGENKGYNIVKAKGGYTVRIPEEDITPDYGEFQEEFEHMHKANENIEKIKELKKQLGEELEDFEDIQKDAKKILNSNSYIREQFKYLDK